MPLPPRSYVRSLLLTVLLLEAVQAPVAHGQDEGLTVQVTYVAGQNLYLDAGRDRGLVPGDTLTVFREGERLGQLTIVSSISDRCVATFAGPPFSATRGTQLQVLLPEARQENTPASPSPNPELPPPATPQPEATTYANPVPAPVRARRTPHISGRVIASFNLLQSTTAWTGSEPGTTKRTFVTPSVNLYLAVRDLPHGMRFRTRWRTDYRYSSYRSIEPTLSARAYEALLEKDFARFSVQAGRFSNRYAPYGGYWDGALVHVGNAQTGFGTAIGFMPDQSNEGFSADMPRYSGFAHVAFGDRNSVRYEANVSYNEIRPTNDLLNHRFAGLSHVLRGGSFHLRNDVQLDRNPENGQWIASRVQVHGSFSPARSLSLHARYAVRQPYSIYRVQRVISYRRDQVQAGFSARFHGVTLGGDVAFNYVEDAVLGRIDDGRILSSYLQLPQTGLLALRFSATASYWQADDASSFFFNTGAARSLGRTQVRLQYQFYRTETLALPLLTHTVMMDAAVPLGPDFSTRSQLRLQRSESLRSVALYTSLSYSF